MDKSNLEVAKALTRLAQTLVAEDGEKDEKPADKPEEGKKAADEAEDKKDEKPAEGKKAAEEPAVKTAAVSRTAAQIEANFREAVSIARDIIAAKPEPRIDVDRLPGLAPMQVKAYIAQIVEARQELEKIRAQYEAVVTQMTNLEGAEKKAVDTLKEAAAQMKEKGRYLVDTEKALLEFTAYTDTKRPGIKQMLFDPADVPVGDKAGELINRISAKLGDQVATAVAQIYRECYEDLSHASDAVRAFKVVAKTAGVDEGRMRKAGLSDFVVGVKDWLSGAADAFTKKVMGFSGDISRWIKGFTERTKIVKSGAKTIADSLDEFKDAMDKANA